MSEALAAAAPAVAAVAAAATPAWMNDPTLAHDAVVKTEGEQVEAEHLLAASVAVTSRSLQVVACLVFGRTK